METSQLIVPDEGSRRKERVSSLSKQTERRKGKGRGCELPVLHLSKRRGSWDLPRSRL